MSIVAYQISGPIHKWVITMDLERISALSLERVRFPVSADSAGVPYNPTAATVQAAFMATDAGEPGGGDWKACTWDTTLIGTYVAGCLVGPGGTVTLAAGLHTVWVKITDATAGESPVRQVGQLLVY